jgi:hypothetical protein
VQGPELNPQYCQKKEEEERKNEKRERKKDRKKCSFSVHLVKDSHQLNKSISIFKILN